MSHAVNITCVCTSISMMLDGLNELREVLTVENVQQETGSAACVENCTGESVKVDFVVKNKSGDRIGLRTNPKTKEVEFVAKEPAKASVKASINAAVQAYARIKILNEVKNRGYGKVKEEKLPNGSIRMVVERWR